MIHSHNEAEHQAILNTIQSLRGVIDALWVEYGNGHSDKNPKLAKSIKVLDKWATTLEVQAKQHVENTTSHDSEVKAWRTVKLIAKWLLGICTAVLIAYLGKQFM